MRFDVTKKPTYAPTLELREVITSAVTYHLRPVRGTKPDHNGFGWALCTINDATGELAIQSDWGSWSNRWDIDHLGRPSLTHFIADRSDVWYLANKLTGSKERNAFDPDATVIAMRKVLVARRLEEGRCHNDRPSTLETRVKRWFASFDEPLTAGIARECWDGLDQLRDCQSEDLFCERFFAVRGSAWITDEPWNHLEHEPTTGYMVLAHSILPALSAACRAQLGKTAAPAPQAPEATP